MIWKKKQIKNKPKQTRNKNKTKTNQKTHRFYALPPCRAISVFRASYTYHTICSKPQFRRSYLLSRRIPLCSRVTKVFNLHVSLIFTTFCKTKFKTTLENLHTLWGTDSNTHNSNDHSHIVLKTTAVVPLTSSKQFL